MVSKRKRGASIKCIQAKTRNQDSFESDKIDGKMAI